MNEEGRGLSCTNQLATAAPVDCSRVRGRRVRFLSDSAPAALAIALAAFAATGIAAATAATLATVFAALAIRFPPEAVLGGFGAFAAFGALAGLRVLAGLGALAGFPIFADFVGLTGFTAFAGFSAFAGFAGLALATVTFFEGLAGALFFAGALLGRAATFFATLFFTGAAAFFACTFAIRPLPRNRWKIEWRNIAAAQL